MWDRAHLVGRRTQKEVTVSLPLQRRWPATFVTAPGARRTRLQAVLGKMVEFV
jgi:coproporphyrinogen III oxidase